jgi:AcrR family transcriptional regulator
MSQPSLPTESGGSARRYGGVSAAERQAQRRERLIEAGLDVFGRMGYSETTMRMICSQARLTDRYFYEQFTDCDEVYKVVHQRLSAEVMKLIAIAASGANPDDPMAIVRAGLTAFYGFIKEDPRRAQILLIDAVTTGLANPLNVNAWVSRYVELMRHRFKTRYPRLDFDLDIELVMGGFVGQVIHTGSVWYQRKFDTPVELLVEHTAYAWSGLHQWLASRNTGASKTS